MNPFGRANLKSQITNKFQIPIYKMTNYFDFSIMDENIFFNSVASLKSLLPSSVYFSLFVSTINLNQ